MREKLLAVWLQMLRVAGRRAEGMPRGGGAVHKGRMRCEQQGTGGNEGEPCPGLAL